MSEYCDIFPEDPSCAVEETPEPTNTDDTTTDTTNVDDGETGSGDADGDNEEADAEGEMMEEMEEEMMEKMEKMDWDMTPSQMWMKAGKLMEFTSINPLMGELTYLMVAIGVTTKYALDLFRYNSASNDDDDYYDNFLTGDKPDSTNWYKTGELIQKYTWLGVFGIAAITQILAGLGIAPFVNMLVWGYGVMLLGSLASFLGMIFKFIGYDTGYANRNLEDKFGDANVQNARNIRTSMVEDMIFETSVALSLYMQAENWHWAAWEALPQEDKETQLEELVAEIEEWDAEKMAEMEGEMKSED